MSFRHIVLFRLHDDATKEKVDEAIAQLESLASLAGVVSMRIEPSLDGRKGRMIVEDATFVNASSFAAFRANEHHVAVGTLMAEISDWWVGDYEN